MGETGRRFGVMLGYLEVMGVTACTAVESYVRDGRRAFSRRHVKAPLSAYPSLTACLLASSALSNISLNYINFPTKVVFRSSKLIPTMLLARCMHGTQFSSVDYACAAAICGGLVLFAAADWKDSPNFSPMGLLLVSLSVLADAVLPNAQQAVFARYGASRAEVTLYTNVLTLGVYTLTTGLSGDAVGFWELLTSSSATSSTLLIYTVVYTTVAYAAITAHMTVVRTHGGVAAVLVATARKGLTLILSFALFPKAFSWLYVVGACLVLGGLLTASLWKQRQKNTNASNSTLASSSPTNATTNASTTLRRSINRGGGGGGGTIINGSDHVPLLLVQPHHDLELQQEQQQHHGDRGQHTHQS